MADNNIDDVSKNPAPIEDPHAGDGDGPVMHIVGRWQGLLDDLGLKVPSAVCGESMAADPDARPAMPTDPLCAACARRARPGGAWVAGHELR